MSVTIQSKVEYANIIYSWVLYMVFISLWWQDQGFKKFILLASWPAECLLDFSLVNSTPKLSLQTSCFIKFARTIGTGFLFDLLNGDGSGLKRVCFLLSFEGGRRWSSTPYATGESGFLLFPQKKKNFRIRFGVWASEIQNWLNFPFKCLVWKKGHLRHAIFKVSPTYHLSIQQGFIVFPSWLGEAFMDSFAVKKTCTNKVKGEREGIFRRFREVVFSLQWFNIQAGIFGSNIYWHLGIPISSHPWLLWYALMTWCHRNQLVTPGSWIIGIDQLLIQLGLLEFAQVVDGMGIMSSMISRLARSQGLDWLELPLETLGISHMNEH